MNVQVLGVRRDPVYQVASEHLSSGSKFTVEQQRVQHIIHVVARSVQFKEGLEGQGPASTPWRK
jgi:hypothetical protein